MNRFNYFVFSLVFVLAVGGSVKAQTLPVGTPVLEDVFRTMQLKGERDSSSSFMIRPLYSGKINEYDSLYHPYGLFVQNSSATQKTFFKNKGVFRVLPVNINQQYNTHHPYGWNDGSMIPAKGYQAQVSAGFFASVGWLSVQFRPEFVFAGNSSFATFPSEHTDSIWKHYYSFLNTIDNPEQFGNGTYAKFFPGQSSIRLNYKKLSLGYSTENLWWGPGIRNSLIMSNNAPGFGHFSFNTTAPVKTLIGHFEWQLIAGTLKNSGILPPDTSRTFEGVPLYVPKNNSDRYINAVVLTWQPKWIKGLFLGFSRSFYQYSDNVPGNLNGYLPVFSLFFKNRENDDADIGRDQLLSLFFRWILQKEQAELYAEYGRNDHSQNASDLLIEPEHSRAYLIGFRKLLKNARNRDVEIMMEFSNLQSPSTSQLRDLQPWYAHYQTRHGYTNRGQVLGAGIGTGSNSQTLGVSWIRDVRRFGVFLERVTRNNDFYYQAFSPMRNYDSHWVDLSLNFTKSWVYRQLLMKADLSLVHSMNYQWRYEENPATLLNGSTNANNIHAGFSVGYIF